MDDLERALPTDIVARAIREGDELVLPYGEAVGAVNIASAALIAVFGIEVFRILEAGLGVETFSGNGFGEPRTWPEFVRLNNEAAVRLLDENRLGRGIGYILTTTSEQEWDGLPRAL